MITSLENYKRKKKIQAQKLEMVRVPIYTSIYREGDKIIGESPSRRKDVLKEE